VTVNTAAQKRYDAPVLGHHGVSLEALRQAVDGELRLLAAGGEAPLDRACAEAVLSPGKRVRPILMLLSGQLFGVPTPRLLRLGCVVESVHAASLVLDDLPSMDNSPLRRGRPALHVVHGEAVAILAAFRLLSRAHAELPHGLALARVPRRRWVAIQEELAGVVGELCQGQVRDLAGEARSVEDLEAVHAGKTGALFVLAARWGAYAGRPSAGEQAAVEAFARNVGLAFQVIDDILDAEGDPEAMGKPVGQDIGRVTFVDLLGIEGSRQLARELVETAMAELGIFGRRGEALRALAQGVIARVS